jgi:hypothetical protein
MQMSQVSRDQAIEKDGPALQSAIQGAVTQKKEIETKEAVRGAEDPKAGAAAIKDRQGGKGGQKAEENAEDPEGKAGEKAPDEIVRDPSLGNRVDLLG